MRNSAGAIVLLLAGIFLLASALLHGMHNIPHLREDMVEIGVRPTLMKAILLVLWFSVLSMFAFAAIVFGAAVKAFRGVRPETMPLWIVATLYTFFGIGAFVLVSPSHHFLGYTLIGLLVASGAFLSAARRTA
jgi:hypothetical protein